MSRTTRTRAAAAPAPASAPTATTAAIERQPGWPAVPGYLDAAAMGVPPAATVSAMREALDTWAAGRATAPGYDADVAAARSHYAALVGVPVEQVAVGAQVSPLVGTVAAAVPDGSRVLTPTGEFTSLTAPFEVQAHRGVTIAAIEAGALAATVARGADVVAFSLAQSRDGSLLDASSLREAAERVGALTVVDLTQAAGWLPIDANAWDVTVCGAYKWLCGPRGTAFLTVRPEVLDRLRPLAAGWYAGAEPWESIYGLGTTLAPNARRLDVSPAWLDWVGTRVSLEAVAAVPSAERRHHGSALADRLRLALGVAPAARPVVSLADADGRLVARLTEADCRASWRAGRLRVSFHLWNDTADVERAAAALRDR